MGIERTDEWLKQHNYQPQEVFHELYPYFKNAKAKELMLYLQQNGMFQSALQGQRDCRLLVEEDVWSKVDKIYKNYKGRWSGPDVPVFIFPYKKQSLFIKSHNKSGLAFPDKLFLFISPNLNEHQLEALFIHEYHHVCRLSKQKKPIEEYTVSDSIILEGLAEYTVQTIKGEKYLAPWTKQYSASFLQSFWNSTFKDLLMIQKAEKRHDQIIYGRGNLPPMIGYCMGFYLVEKYFIENHFSVHSTFSLPISSVIDKFKQK